jgi:hypothetical protein
LYSNTHRAAPTPKPNDERRSESGVEHFDTEAIRVEQDVLFFQVFFMLHKIFDLVYWLCSTGD